MKIRITSISWRGVSDSIRSVTMDMENALSKPFSDLSFGSGIDQLTIVIISASSDDSENYRLCKGYNKIARLRNPITRKPIKSISLAIPINSDVVGGMTKLKLCTFICESVLRKIASPDIRIPKDFDYSGFSECLSTAIGSFSHTRCGG
jgi:hypothetical protein